MVPWVLRTYPVAGVRFRLKRQRTVSVALRFCGRALMGMAQFGMSGMLTDQVLASQLTEPKLGSMRRLLRLI